MDNEKIPKLQKCPFCGKDFATIVDQFELNDYHDKDEDKYARMYTVVCDHEKGGCGATCGFKSSPYYASLSWNTRW